LPAGNSLKLLGNREKIAYKVTNEERLLEPPFPYMRGKPFIVLYMALNELEKSPNGMSYAVFKIAVRLAILFFIFSKTIDSEHCEHSRRSQRTRLKIYTIMQL
jgi:hypothetical protein